MCSRFTVRRSRRYLKHEFRLGDSSAKNTQEYTYMHIVYYLYKYIYINNYKKYRYENIFNEKRTNAFAYAGILFLAENKIKKKKYGDCENRED